MFEAHDPWEPGQGIALGTTADVVHTGFMSRFVLLLLAVVALLGATEPEHVHIQLSWYHQFQFAGIYAAESRGYFADEALAVEIREYAPGCDIPFELESGRTQFAVYDSKILDEWARGRDIGLLAIIHQRSPSVMLVHANSPFLTLADLLQAPPSRLVSPANDSDPELRLALSALSADPMTVFSRRKQAGDLEAFVRGELDVLPGYASNEPFRLQRMGVEIRSLRYQSNGQSAFFGDVLACRGELLRSRPDLANRFRRAVLRGWTWALDHHSEAATLTLNRWPSSQQSATIEQLLDEAVATEGLVDRQIVELGSISASRLDSIAALMRSAGLPGMVRADLIWRPSDPSGSWVRVLAWSLGMAAAACIVLMALVWVIRRQLVTSTLSHERMMELAEAFFLFQATVEGGSRLRMRQASPSITTILGGTRSSYLADADVLLRQILPDDRQAFLSALSAAISSKSALRHRLRITHPDHATPRHLLLHAMPTPGSDPPTYDGLILDLTAEADAAEALLEVQRRLQTAQSNESLGLLAGGVAHDFNNLLGAIRGNAELALGKLPDGHEAKPRVQRVMQAADRAAGLVRQILAYAGKGSVEVHPIDLVEECRVLRDLLKHAVPAGATIRLDADSGLPPVLFDPSQLQQVLVNLIVNAGESYGGKPGEVHITVVRDPGNPNHIRVQIIDRGCGMDEQTQQRMFEPYFTTKKTGHGLGLAAVQGIVTASGASLTCTSHPNQGTTFTLSIPIAASIRTTSRIDTPDPIAGRHLLVVDDDEMLCEMAAQMARDLGYTVETASGGEAALSLLADRERPYNAAIIDCSMPDRQGTEVVRERRIAGDRRPIILVSGMVEAARIGTGILDRRTRFLAKPFSRAMLDRTLRIMLRPEPDDESSSNSTFASLQRESSIQMSIRSTSDPPDDASSISTQIPPTH